MNIKITFDMAGTKNTETKKDFGFLRLDIEDFEKNWDKYHADPSVIIVTNESPSCVLIDEYENTMTGQWRKLSDAVKELKNIIYEQYVKKIFDKLFKTNKTK